MTVIFDFDYTLYNTDRLKKAFFSAAQRAGVSSDAYEATLPAAYSDSYATMGGGGAYSSQKHCELIGNYANCDVEFLHRFFHQAVQQSYLYVYDDVVGALEELREQGYCLVLLTFGNKELQRSKVEASGIEQYIDDVVYVEEADAKHTVLPVKDDEEFIFVNDNPAENKKVQEAYPHARVFQMVRPNAFYDADPNQTTIRSLEEVCSQLQRTKSKE